MKIDFSQVLRQLNGEAINEPTGQLDEQKQPVLQPATLGSLACAALLRVGDDPQRPASAQDKLKAGHLIHRIYRKTLVDIESGDVAFIKEKVGEIATPLVIVQAFEMLETPQLASVEAIEGAKNAG